MLVRHPGWAKGEIVYFKRERQVLRLPGPPSRRRTLLNRQNVLEEGR